MHRRQRGTLTQIVAVPAAVLALVLLVQLAFADEPAASEPPNGSGPDTATNVVYKVGDTIHARNGLTGKVFVSGKDAGRVIQAAIDACHDEYEGGLVHIKAGSYTLNKAIILRQAVSIRGEGTATVLNQTNVDECGIVYIGSYRETFNKLVQFKDDDPNIYWFKRYGVSGYHHVAFAISDLFLAGPGEKGRANGIHLEFANAYRGPMLIKGVRVAGFGNWNIWAYHCWGGGMAIRDSAIRGVYVGNGIYLEDCHGAMLENLEVFNLREKDGIGVYVQNGFGVNLTNVVAENHKKLLGVGFLVRGNVAQSVTLQSCYSETSKYGVLIKDTPGCVSVLGSHLSSGKPITIDNGQNIIIRGNSFQKWGVKPGYCIFVSPESTNIEIGINRYWDELEGTTPYARDALAEKIENEHDAILRGTGE